MSRLTFQKRDGNYSLRFDLGNLQQVDIKAMNKLGKIENLMEKYKINDLTELEIALDYYEHRYDKVETRRANKNE